MNKRDARSQERTTSQAPAKVRWCGSAGEARFARGKIVNNSDGGICVELGEPIRGCSYVQLDSAELRCADWGGAVRHCAPKGIKFRIGLELTTRPRSK